MWPVGILLWLAAGFIVWSFLKCGGNCDERAGRDVERWQP